MTDQEWQLSFDDLLTKAEAVAGRLKPTPHNSEERRVILIEARDVHDKIMKSLATGPNTRLSRQGRLAAAQRIELDFTL